MALCEMTLCETGVTRVSKAHSRRGVEPYHEQVCRKARLRLLHRGQPALHPACVAAEVRRRRVRRLRSAETEADVSRKEDQQNQQQ